MATPSEKDIQEAKSYLLTRLSAEQSGEYNLEQQLRHAARQINALCREYNIRPEDIESFRKMSASFDRKLRAIINAFIDELYDITEDLCVYAEEKDKWFIIPFINAEIYGDTLKGRLEAHSDTFLAEWLSFLATLQKVPTTANTEQIRQTHAFNNLNRLIRHTISRTYMEEWKHKHANAKGFYSYRGSSYPCETCDDYVGYHPMSDYRLPLHPNCMCYAVFTNDIPETENE